MLGSKQKPQSKIIMDEWTLVGGVLALCLLVIGYCHVKPTTAETAHEDDVATDEFPYKPVTIGIYSILKNTYIQTYQRYVRHVDNVPDMEHLAEIVDAMLDRFDIQGSVYSELRAGNGYSMIRRFQTETDMYELRLLDSTKK